MEKVNRSSTSLVDLLREAVAHDELKRTTARPRATPPAGRVEIVSPKEERGVRYRGDFPNPSGAGYRGCF